MNAETRESQSEPTGAAIVTGGASGIGRALAEELARRGTHVVLADRQVELAEDVAHGIHLAGGAATVAELDVRDCDAFKKVVEETVARSGQLDYLFNNAGIGVSGEIREYEPRDWDEVFDVNLRGVAYGVLAAYPVMIRQGRGHIINTASMAGLTAGAFSGSYTATKHAVVGLSKALRIEARPYGVRVSVLCPGVIRTPILEGGRYGRLKNRVDMGKLMEVWERFRPMAPEVFAERAMRAVDRNRAIIIEPRWWKLFWYMDRLSPGLSDLWARAFYGRAKRMMDEIRVD